MTQTPSRPDAALVDAVRGIGTATLHEAGGQIGALPSYIKPVSNDWYVCGAAMTVLSAAEGQPLAAPRHLPRSARRGDGGGHGAASTRPATGARS